jgi:hypothetical protein
LLRFALLCFTLESVYCVAAPTQRLQLWSITAFQLSCDDGSVGVCETDNAISGARPAPIHQWQKYYDDHSLSHTQLHTSLCICAVRSTRIGAGGCKLRLMG